MVKTGKAFSVLAIIVLAIMVVSLAPAPVAGTACDADVWVAPPPIGNDGNPGTQAQPFATIQQGIDMVCDQGTVHVAPGTYFEHLYINFACNLVGSGAPVTIIDGGIQGTNVVDGGSVITISSAPDEVNVISGFTIRNGDTTTVDSSDPENPQVIYAGIKLPAKTLSRPSNGIVGGCIQPSASGLAAD